MRRYTSLCLFSALVCAFFAQAQNISWRAIQPGVEFASLTTGKMASGDSGTLYVVRVDPARAKLTVALALESQSKPRTAAEWCRTAGLSVAINVGMYQTDLLSNVGYLRHGSHVNNPRWNADNAVLALNGSSPALWVDRDVDTRSLNNYDIVVQNLRLITKSRKNVWAPNARQWSEAALAIDSKRRLLFLFTRAPWSMREFNDELLRLPLDVAGAMHLEGGPEASLSIHGGGVDLDLAGSFETGFWPDDSNVKQWAIPNVLGVAKAK